MDYTQFVPKRKSIIDADIEAAKLEKAQCEEAHVKGLRESIKAISETAQVVEEAKVKDGDLITPVNKASTGSQEFKTERGEK